MIRGTTPTLTFKLPFECEQITTVSVVFAQNEEIVIEKKLDDCAFDGKKLILTLTEDETLLLDCHKNVEIQIRCACGATKMASDIVSVDVGRILKDGCLE